MYPVLLKLGPISIYSYGLMIAVGLLTALFFIRRDAQREGFEPHIFDNMVFYGIPLGVVGARVAHILIYPETYSWSEPMGWIAVWNGGLVFQGVLPVALAFAYFYLRKNGVPFLRGSDVMFPYFPLAHGFGRVGCFMYGCCYGKPTDMPWGIPFRRVPWDTSEAPTGSPAYLDHLERYSDMTLSSHWSHAIHPTQLYSFAGLILICLLLLALRKRWHPFVGFTMPAYLVVYGIFRFVVEFFRGDHNPVHVLSLTDQQVFSAGFVLLGIILFFVLQRRSTNLPAEESA